MVGEKGWLKREIDRLNFNITYINFKLVTCVNIFKITSICIYANANII